MHCIKPDTSGLHQAERAWSKIRLNTTQNQLLPGLGVYNPTPERLFYQAFARCFCANIRPEAALERVSNDPVTCLPLSPFIFLSFFTFFSSSF